MPPFLQSLYDLFQTPVPLPPLGATSYGEILANLFGIVCVYLCAKEHLWNWPTGIANNFLLIFLFFPAKLYADTVLQVIYIGIAIYGWWSWLHGGENKTELQIHRTTKKEWVILGIAAVVGTLVWGGVLHRYTDTDVPFWDSGTAVVCLIAQYMMGRKLLENWPVWITTNLSYVLLYWHKHFYVTMAVQPIYLWLSILGYLHWRKALREAEAARLATAPEAASTLA